MEIVSTILICLCCTALAAVPYWLFNRWTKSRTEYFMMAIAHKFGLTPSAFDPKNLPTVAGRYRNHSTTIAASFTANEHHFPLTRVIVRLNDCANFQVRIVQNSFLASSPDEEYFPFGDEVLDKELQLASTDNDRTKELFDTELLSLMHKALSLGCQRGELVIDDFEIRYTYPQHMLVANDFELVSQMVEVSHELAERVDKSQSSALSSF